MSIAPLGRAAIELAALVVAFHGMSYWIYFLQLKEYRLDRLRASFETWHDLRTALVRQFTLRHWYVPKLTARAVTSALIASALFLAAFFEGEIRAQS